MLDQLHELGAPPHGHAVLGERGVEESLGLVLAQHQDVRVGAQVATDVADRYARLVLAVRPQVGTRRPGTVGHRRCGQPSLGEDLERARLHADRPCLLGGTGVTVDDEGADTAPDQVVREHQAARSCADDQYLRFHRSLVHRRSRGFSGS